MKIFVDYHTHTPYSHGKNSILQNAEVAKERGLKIMGCSDHGPGHFLNGISVDSLHNMRRDCIEAERLTGVKVLLGIEGNVVDFSGSVDFNEFKNKLDYVMCGMHACASVKGIKQKWHFLVRRKLFTNTKKQVALNTKIICNCIEKNGNIIDIFTHPDRGFPCDIITVAQVLKNNDVIYELNCKSFSLSDKTFKEVVATGVKFIFGSDAHSKEKVGDFQKFERLLKFIPEEQYVLELNPKIKRLKI